MSLDNVTSNRGANVLDSGTFRSGWLWLGGCDLRQWLSTALSNLDNENGEGPSRLGETQGVIGEQSEFEALVNRSDTESSPKQISTHVLRIQ